MRIQDPKAELDRTRPVEEIDQPPIDSLPASDAPAFTGLTDAGQIDPVAASTANKGPVDLDSGPMKSLAPVALAVMVMLVAIGTIAAVAMP